MKRGRREPKQNGSGHSWGIGWGIAAAIAGALAEGMAGRWQVKDILNTPIQD